MYFYQYYIRRNKTIMNSKLKPKNDKVMKAIVLKEFVISAILTFSLFLISQIPPINLIGANIYYILIFYMIYTLCRSVREYKILIFKVVGLSLNLMVMSLLMYFTKQTPFFPSFLLDLLTSLFS